MRTMMVGLLLAVAASAQAGVVLTMETVDGKTKSATVAKVDADRFRVDTEGGKRGMIYRKDKDAFWILDAAKKTWTEMTRADIEAMGQRMSGMMKQMEAQLKDLPAEQRAQVEAMMKGRMGGGASAPSYRKLATGQSVGKWVATQYAVERDGKKTAEVFHADPKAVGLTDADFAVFTSLAEMLKSMTQGLESAGIYLPGKPGGDAPAGVLVRSVQLTAEGKPGAVTTLIDVKRGPVAAADFEIPSGWKKGKSPMAGHGPGDGHHH